jgi:hypothetical protein
MAVASHGHGMDHCRNSLPKLLGLKMGNFSQQLLTIAGMSAALLGIPCLET